MMLDPVDCIVDSGDHLLMAFPGWLQMRYLLSGLGWAVKSDSVSFLESCDLAKQSHWAFVLSLATFI
jgi:hypothetical protein